MSSEHALYVKTTNSSDMLFVFLYVDDIIFLGNNQNMIKEFKMAMIS